VSFDEYKDGHVMAVGFEDFIVEEGSNLVFGGRKGGEFERSIRASDNFELIVGLVNEGAKPVFDFASDGCLVVSGGRIGVRVI
jgi:hypothetical protein